MKKISFMFVFVALLSTVAFASSEPEPKITKVEFQFDQLSQNSKKGVKKTKVTGHYVAETTCEVSAFWSSVGNKVSGKISINCDCTAEQAFDIAHKIFSIAIPEQK